MKVMGKTITGAASGETDFCGAEGFTISGKRTEEDFVQSRTLFYTFTQDWCISNLFLFLKMRWKKWKEEEQ
jgi:hypothetical protein